MLGPLLNFIEKTLKGRVSRDCQPLVFCQLIAHKPQMNTLKYFRICRDIQLQSLVSRYAV
jgi:hypothetical protein